MQQMVKTDFTQTPFNLSLKDGNTLLTAFDHLVDARDQGKTTDDEKHESIEKKCEIEAQELSRVVFRKNSVEGCLFTSFAPWGSAVEEFGRKQGTLGKKPCSAFRKDC